MAGLECSLGWEGVVLGDVRSKNQGGDGGKLDQDVDGWAGGVLERVTHGVSNDGGDVSLSELSLLQHPDADLLCSLGVGLTSSLEALVLLLVGGKVSTSSLAFSFV